MCVSRYTMTMARENYRYIDYLVSLLTFRNRIPSHLCNVLISGPFFSIHDQSLTISMPWTVHNLLSNGKWSNRVLYSILFALNNYICLVPSYLYNVSCLWVISEIFVANGKTFWVVSKSSEISRPIKLCCDWFTANDRTKRGFSRSFRQWITTNWSNKTDKGGEGG